MKASFGPVVDTDTRLLILGSLPGEASLARGQYYAHPTNGFWRLLGPTIGADLHAMSYEDRLAALLKAGVGLWDVVKQANRIGSLDASIRDIERNDLASRVAGLPNLRAVAFNGGKAAAIGLKQLKGHDHLPQIVLPSSSAAYASLPFAAKAEAWRALAAHLDGD